MNINVGNFQSKKIYIGDNLVYIDGFGKKLYKRSYGATTFTDLTSSVTWNATTGRYECAINNNVGDEVFVTFDGEEPKPNYSNIVFYYVCASVTGTYTIITASPWTDGTTQSLVFMTL